MFRDSDPRCFICGKNGLERAGRFPMDGFPVCTKSGSAKNLITLERVTNPDLAVPKRDKGLIPGSNLTRSATTAVLPGSVPSCGDVDNREKKRRSEPGTMDPKR